jgi:hypothetical protein
MERTAPGFHALGIQAHFEPEISDYGGRSSSRDFPVRWKLAAGISMNGDVVRMSGHVYLSTFKNLISEKIFLCYNLFDGKDRA